MKRAETLRLMTILNKDAAEPRALFVGGCVRNAVLDRPVGDIDIATRLTPDQVISKLEAENIRVIPTGIDHGTVTAVLNGHTYEITTLRRDVETDGRRAVISFTEDWAEDAQRRDFTMNTLLADDEGHIYDPTGHGCEDARTGRVVFVGDPAQRIAEDYLRILRFFRFHACYGQGAPDQQALTACRQAADKIALLSRERITQEFLKILMADSVVSIVDLMFRNNVLKDIADPAYDDAVLERLQKLQNASHHPDVVARLFVVTGYPLRAEIVDRYLNLSQEQKKTAKALSETTASLKKITEKDVRLLLYNHKKSVSIQSVLVSWALKRRPRAFVQKRILTILQHWQPPVLPIKGDDIMQFGIPAGPAVGEALEAVQAWWIGHDFLPDRAACLAFLRKWLAGKK